MLDDNLLRNETLKLDNLFIVGELQPVKELLC